MKKHLKQISILLGIIFAFNSCKDNKKFHELREKNYDISTPIKEQIDKDTSYSDYHLGFFNNPYHFDSTCFIKLILNDKVVYQGRFHSPLELKVPRRFDNQSIQTTIIIQKGNKWFSGSKKGESFILNNANDPSLNWLNVVFFPDRGDPDNFIIFDGWVE